MAELNDTETARAALDDTWRQLAQWVERVKDLEALAAEQPELLRNDQNLAALRLLTAFDRELAAVQTIHDAAASGRKLPSDELRAARKTAEKLLEFVADVPPAARPAAGPSTRSSGI
jgi:hypothetical protein